MVGMRDKRVFELVEEVAEPFGGDQIGVLWVIRKGRNLGRVARVAVRGDSGDNVIELRQQLQAKAEAA